MATIDLCQECKDSTDTSKYEYNGMTMSMPPDCTQCGGVMRGKYSYSTKK